MPPHARHRGRFASSSRRTSTSFFRPLLAGVLAATAVVSSSEVSAQTTQVAVTLRLENQNNVEIAGSEIAVFTMAGQIPGNVHTGDSKLLDVGHYSFQLRPWGPGTANQLRRVEEQDVTASTTQLTFRWETEDVVIRASNQYGDELPMFSGTVGALIQLVTDAGGATGIEYCSGDLVQGLPRTTVAGATGDWADGYPLRVVPFHCDFELARIMQPEAVGEGMTTLDLEWPTAAIPVRVVNQDGHPIATPAGAAIQFQGFSNGGFPSGQVVELPIPEMGDTGIYANGYDFRVLPLGSGSLARELNDQEVTATTPYVEMVWPTLDCALRLVDNPGMNAVADSDLALPFEYIDYEELVVYTFPTTDETFNSTVAGYGPMTGSYVNGYPITVFPGDLSTSGSFTFEVSATGAVGGLPFTVSGNSYTFICLPDNDDDGLVNEVETNTGVFVDRFDTGTDPNNADTDGDGAPDGAEVRMQMDTPCPNPLIADSDGDTLSDGEEIYLGTDPCDPNTDGDALPDNLDPNPNDPDDASDPDVLETAARLLCDDIRGFDPLLFMGNKLSSREGRVNSLSNRCGSAANAIADGNYPLAINHLSNVLAKVDGDDQQVDWVLMSPEQMKLADDLNLLIALLQ